MHQKIIIQSPKEKVKSNLESAILKSNALLLKRIDNTGFYFLSRKNYGTLSMVEKEYYRIKGKFKAIGDQTEITYEIKGNATYRILSVVLPIMMLPTVFLSATGDKGNLINGLVIYLFLSGIAVLGLLSREKKLVKMGENDFKRLLEAFE